ncbi:hypothetical protein J5X84_38630 [Streptosporangiaceae bacterium NEAU-GS5]|nr:hypothetical protein [Streptosporangiaceae bacterium NEAU-GS5]
MIRWTRPRLVRWGSIAVIALLVVGGAAWWSYRELQPCGRLDLLLNSSGCAAVRTVPWFTVGTKSRPGVAFTPDGKRLAMVGIEVEEEAPEPEATSEASRLPLQRAALVTIDVSRATVVNRVNDGAYQRGLAGAFGVSSTGRYAAGVFLDPGSLQEGQTEGPDAKGSGRIRVWRLDGRPGGWQSPQMTLSHQALVQFSADDAVLRVDDRFFDVGSGKQLSSESVGNAQFYPGWGTGDGAFSPDRGVKVTWNYRTGVVAASEAASGRVVRELPTALDPGQAQTVSFRFSPSGKRLAMRATLYGGDVMLQGWEVGSGRRILSLTSSMLGIETAWSPDEKTLAVSTSGMTQRTGEGVALFHLP